MNTNDYRQAPGNGQVGDISNDGSAQYAHSSKLLNKIDPRVDQNNPAVQQRQQDKSSGGSTSAGTAGYGGNAQGYNTGPNAGPHQTNTANQIDPRVDPSRQGYGGAGFGGSGAPTGAGPNTGNPAAGYQTGRSAYPQTSQGYQQGGDNYNTNTSSGYGSNTTGSNTSGPHRSDIANKLDPRVDSSKNDHSDSGYGAPPGQTTGVSQPTGVPQQQQTGVPQSGAGQGYNTTQNPTYGNGGAGYNGNGQAYNAPGQNYGGANTTNANDGNYAQPAGQPGQGSMKMNVQGLSLEGQGTRGRPHKSELLNKLDPRVGN